MPRGSKPKEPMHVTPVCGIRIISEHIKWNAEGNPYVYYSIRPHPFFSGVCVRRSRVVMTEHLNRKLWPHEHVHHGKLGTENDTLENLELLDASAHNQHHKLGTKHTDESKKKISASLKTAYDRGLRTAKWDHLNRDEEGKFTS